MTRNLTIFEPLGWLSPVIISAKMMMQEVWKADIGWDELVTGTLLKEWLDFQTNLNQLSLINIPRCILPKAPLSIHLAGFCDASEKAHGAVVYTYAYFNNSSSVISIITSKTRVAPVKHISLPRRELCSALLLAELMSSVPQALKIPFTFRQHRSVDGLHSDARMDKCTSFKVANIHSKSCHTNSN
jgi:hypothetical protein